jgi:hypothetical protein
MSQTYSKADSNPATLRFKELEMVLEAEGYKSRNVSPLTTNIEEQVQRMVLDYLRDNAEPKPIKLIQITFR